MLKLSCASQPNVLLILADQLRADALSIYGQCQIRTNRLDELAAEGISFEQAISSCPVCTPARAMLLTGRHPQTTGHIINSTRTRHDELSLADAFGRAGYRTGYAGKWHLHTGAFPAENQPDFVPMGRDRLGFDYWRAYNMHMVYFNGWVQSGDWECERWAGYETEALAGYAREFMAVPDERPFLMVLAPHQPHWTPYTFAPQACYDALPEKIMPPPGARGHAAWDYAPEEMYRHYLAMTLALDAMVGQVLDDLAALGKARDTLVLLTSDHGTQAGQQGVHPWEKRHPYEGSIRIPMIARWPGQIPAGGRSRDLIALPDVMPSLCRLAGVPVPRTVEGRELAAAFRGEACAAAQEAVLLMNFSSRYDWFAGGLEWRGVRTALGETYARWLDGREDYYDVRSDPHQLRNLAGRPECLARQRELMDMLAQLQARRGDALLPAEAYRPWHDAQRRVVRNAFGPLPHPESEPNWDLLQECPRV